ncbi:unnamed protein product [Ilex paraguariensis]|uniref:LOB domain-containing protein n=1 Tax=Ilex paraguariensis TaxID=185542 RepID=A0ABC8R793_9AQUA
MASGTGSPCGACKFLRRKCATDCIFAPYFCSEQGPAIFAAIHKVFGASNVSKLLLHVPVADRCEAVVTIGYEAQARIRDPVYGCVAHIFALQQQVVKFHRIKNISFCVQKHKKTHFLLLPLSLVAYLQAQLMQLKAQLAQNLIDSSRNNPENQWPAGNIMAGMASFPAYLNSISPQSSVESIEHNNEGMGVQEIQIRDELSFQPYSKRRPSQTDLGELQALALRMMRN